MLKKKYKSKVNDTFIYDLSPVPDDVTDVNVIEIPDWNVNCCKGPHLKSTGELGAILLLKNKFRQKRNEWELSFVVGNEALKEMQSGTKKELSQGNIMNKPQSELNKPPSTEVNQPPATEVNKPPSTEPNKPPSTELNKPSTELDTTERKDPQVSAPILSNISPSVYPKLALDIGIEELVALLLPRLPNTTANQLSQEISPILNRLNNSAYTSGFKAASTRSIVPTKNLL